jgi:hypothetical protein
VTPFVDGEICFQKGNQKTPRASQPKKTSQN